MRNKKKALEIITEKLRGIPWAIFAGTAVEIYTNGKRIGNDIDIIVPEDMIDEIGKRFNATPVLETYEKGRVKIVNDYHIETVVDSIPVEFVGKTEKIVIDGQEYRSTENLRETVFTRLKKKRYLGVEVFVSSVEEILVQKMLYNRSGQWQDKDDVKLLLQTEKVSEEEMIRAFERWGVSKEKQKAFLEELK